MIFIFLSTDENNLYTKSNNGPTRNQQKVLRQKMTDVKVNRWERGDNIFAKDGVSVIGAVETTSVITQSMELFQNVPNPVMDNTSISFYLPEDATVRLTVSNTLGQEIMTLSDSSFLKGMHTVEMDATSLSTGVYFYKLEANKTSLTKQLTLVK